MLLLKCKREYPKMIRQIKNSSVQIIEYERGYRYFALTPLCGVTGDFAYSERVMPQSLSRAAQSRFGIISTQYS